MNVAPIAGWRESYYVAQLDRDGRIVKALSAVFESRSAAERVHRWKRRKPGVVLVQLLTTARVLA